MVNILEVIAKMSFSKIEKSSTLLRNTSHQKKRSFNDTTQWASMLAQMPIESISSSWLCWEGRRLGDRVMRRENLISWILMLQQMLRCPTAWWVVVMVWLVVISKNKERYVLHKLKLILKTNLTLMNQTYLI